MPHLGVADRVKETTTTTGTGTLNLDGAVAGFQTFVDGVGNGHETYYVIVDSGTGDYEVGVGTITDAATDTLSRDSVITSSNAGSLVNFGAGEKDVFCSLPSERAVIIDDASNVEVTANITATSFDGSGAALTSLNASNVSSGTLPNARLDAQLQDIAGLATTSGKIIQGDGANFVLSAYTIPTSDGTTGQVLTTNGSGAVTFQTPTVGDITAVTAGSGLTGGGTTGDVTLNVGAGTGVTVNADDIAIGQDVATSASPTFAGATFTANVSLGDSDYLRFGASQDLQIFHDGSNSYIIDNGTGNLIIRGVNLDFQSTTGEDYINCTSNGGVTLRYDTAGKLSTTSGGVTVTGTVTADGLSLGDNETINIGASNDLQIYHTGVDSFIRDAGTGNLRIQATNFKLENAGATQSMIEGYDGGAVDLRYAGATRLYTTTGGVFITGGIEMTADLDMGDNDKILLGSSDDLQIYHDGTQSIIEDVGTGQLQLRSNGIGVYLQKDNSEYLARFVTDGASELYYDGSKKLETTSGGATVTGTLTGTQLAVSGAATFRDNTGEYGSIEITGGATTSWTGYSIDGQVVFMNNGSLGGIYNDINNQWILKSTYNGATTIQHAGSDKLATTSSGVTVTGTVTADGVSVGDNENIQLGASNDLRMFHDGVGGNSYIQDAGTGDLYLDFSDDFIIRKFASAEVVAQFNSDGAVELYYDNSKKFETTSAGVTVTGTLTETSSIEYKENVKPLEFNEAIYNVNAVKYDRKDGSQKDEVGVIAEDLYEILPDLVQTKDGKPESVKYTKLTMYLLEALKKQNEEIQELKKRIN